MDREELLSMIKGDPDVRAAITALIVEGLRSGAISQVTKVAPGRDADVKEG